MNNQRSYRLANDGNLQFSSTVDSIPELGPREVLVRMGAASLNYRDLLVIQDVGNNHEGLIPLSDGAGTVIATGSGVLRWKVGHRVSPGFFPNWRVGAFSAATLAVALGGGQTDGVLSELIVVHESSLVEVAAHLSLVEAATLPCAGVTAWHALFERGGLQEGETVLVQGTGGVALFGL